MLALESNVSAQAKAVEGEAAKPTVSCQVLAGCLALRGSKDIKNEGLFRGLWLDGWTTQINIICFGALNPYCG